MFLFLYRVFQATIQNATKPIFGFYCHLSNNKIHKLRTSEMQLSSIHCLAVYITFKKEAMFLIVNSHPSIAAIRPQTRISK